MIYKITSPIPLHVRVVFELPACLWADQIYLVGDFNNWDETATPLRQTRNGVWRVVLDLPVNHRFEYRYHVGEQWYTDYRADGSATSPYQTLNSVVDTTLSLESMHVSRHLHVDSHRPGSSIREGSRISDAGIVTAEGAEYAPLGSRGDN